jgi:hypothetical protein
MRSQAMIRAMMKAVAKVIKEMPWWQKALIGSAAAVAFSAAAKAMEYFLQGIEDPVNKKSDKLPPEDKRPLSKSAGSAGFSRPTRR